MKILSTCERSECHGDNNMKQIRSLLKTFRLTSRVTLHSLSSVNPPET